MSAPAETPLATALRVLEIEANAILDLRGRLHGPFERAVELLLACRGRVVVSGSITDASHPVSSRSSRRAHSRGASPGSRRPAGTSYMNCSAAYRYWRISSTWGSSPAGSDRKGTTADAPG